MPAQRFLKADKAQSYSRPRLVDRLPLPSSDLLAFPTAPHHLPPQAVTAGR